MPNFICMTCGVQYSESDTPPAVCAICQDERQYVNPAGQQWTTLVTLQAERHNDLHAVEPGLTSIRTNPLFAISQQAYWIETPQGNVLWDCISLVDPATVAAIQARGGLSAIAISHPHFYSSMVEWNHAFGHIPIYLHASDRQWIMRPDPAIRLWEGDAQRINDHVTLIRCGGHFDGSTALHWTDGAGGKGVEPAPPFAVQDCLGHDRTGRVSGAKEKDVVDAVFGHLAKPFPPDVRLFRSRR